MPSNELRNGKKLRRKLADKKKASDKSIRLISCSLLFLLFIKEICLFKDFQSECLIFPNGNYATRNKIRTSVTKHQEVFRMNSDANKTKGKRMSIKYARFVREEDAEPPKKKRSCKTMRHDLMNPFSIKASRKRWRERMKMSCLTIRVCAVSERLKLLNQWLTIANKIKFNFLWRVERQNETTIWGKQKKTIIYRRKREEIAFNFRFSGDWFQRRNARKFR